MKVLLYPFLLCLLVAFSSCKKKHTVHIKAINAVTGAPYAGLPYAINGSRTGTNGEKLVFEHKGTLDANGEAAPTIKIKENLTFHVGVTKPPNNCYQKDINFFWDAKANPSPSFLFEYAECANLRERITNINCQGPSDYMILHTSNQVNSLGTSGWEFFGCNGYFTEDYSKVPIGKYYHKWVVTKNNITNTYYDTIELVENQFASFDIDY